MRREGSVKQAADGTWGFVVDIAPSGALRRQVRRRGFRTKGEAQRELTKVLHSLGEGTFVAPERLTLGEYLESWLAGLAVAGKRQTTITSYRERLTLHVQPRLGAARLQALTALDLDGSTPTSSPTVAGTARAGSHRPAFATPTRSSARPWGTPDARS